MYRKALAIAKKAHKGQKDQQGVDYIQHPLAVAANFKNEVSKTIAILHDVVEDSPLTVKDLEKAGFPPEVTEGVDAMSRRKGESYEAYIKRLKKTPQAIPVKLADLRHNMSPHRLLRDSEKQARLQERYQKAYSYLSKRD